MHTYIQTYIHTNIHTYIHTSLIYIVEPRALGLHVSVIAYTLGVL